MTDNRDILDDAEIDFLLQAAGPDVEQEIPELDTGYQTVTMHGDLDQIHLADIFQTLSMSKMEGVLRVRNPLDERQVYCYDGQVRVLAPLRVSLRQLGQRLVQAGILPAEELRAAIVEHAKSKISLGQLLIRDGIVTPEELERISSLQASEDLYSLFTWRRGTFEFFRCDGDTSDLRRQFEERPAYEIGSLLLEVARRSDEWETILGAVQSLDEVPRQIAQPASPDDLDDAHLIVLEHLDGRHTIRQLAEQTTIGLFEFARAARDLVVGGIADLIDDPALVKVASEFAVEGESKLAILALQTLRDRPGDRSIGIIRSMALVLEQTGERRFASTMLLEAAQRSAVAEEAIELARHARNLVPYDPGTLSFLRTVLLAHSDPNSTELEKCTIDLVDALIDNDRISTALEICDDARRTGSMRPQILTREARARQKSKDTEGAIANLLEIVEHYKQENNRPKAIEALKAIQRLDRNRKDVQKALIHLHRTRLGTAIRIAAALLVVGLMASVGMVWWEQEAFDESLRLANAEVQTLLDQGDRNGAKTKLDGWVATLGKCQGLDDLEIRVQFALAAETTRLRKLQRTRSNQQLTEAATAIGQGNLEQALDIYCEVHAQKDMQKEVAEVVAGRLRALANELHEASQSLRSSMPPNPGELFDRAEITANLATLQGQCSPALMRCYDVLRQMLQEDKLPPFLEDATRVTIASAIESSQEDMERCRTLAKAYTKALERNDIQRRLDPMFKAAVAKEAEYDFTGALELYRQLEAQPTDDLDLRTHFRDQVNRNATIVRLLQALGEATNSGDHETAAQHLRALRVSFPKVPFDQIARLPLRVTSQPKNATVTVNGVEVGQTPVVLAHVPATPTNIIVSCEGFEDLRHQVRGDAQAGWTAKLKLKPTTTWQHTSPIETPPYTTKNGGELFVDRSGKVVMRSAGIDKTTWVFESDDLSGWLTEPVTYRDCAVIGSLDGPLRAINLSDGTVAWSLEQLPCEVQPTLVAEHLAIATTDGRLHAITLTEQAVTSVDLPEPAYGSLLSDGERVFSIGRDGTINAWTMPTLTKAWQLSLPDMRSPHASLTGSLIIAGDDQGRVFGVDTATGSIKWHRELETSAFGGPITANNRVVYVSHSKIQRLDARTGRSLTEFPSGNRDWAGPATVIGNRMLVPLRNDSLQVLDAETGQLLYRILGDSQSRILATRGRLFVISKDHTVRCYGRLR